MTRRRRCADARKLSVVAACVSDLSSASRSVLLSVSFLRAVRASSFQEQTRPLRGANRSFTRPAPKHCLHLRDQRRVVLLQPVIGLLHRAAQLGASHRGVNIVSLRAWLRFGKSQLAQDGHPFEVGVLWLHAFPHVCPEPFALGERECPVAAQQARDGLEEKGGNCASAASSTREKRPARSLSA